MDTKCPSLSSFTSVELNMVARKTWCWDGGQCQENTNTHLVGLHQNEDVVHPDSQHQEWDDFDHDEGQGDPNVAEDAQRAGHRAQHHQDACNAQRDLGIHLGRGGEQSRKHPSAEGHTSMENCPGSPYEHNSHACAIRW